MRTAVQPLELLQSGAAERRLPEFKRFAQTLPGASQTNQHENKRTEGRKILSTMTRSFVGGRN